MAAGDHGNATDGVSIIHYSLFIIHYSLFTIHYSLKSCLQAASAFSLVIYPLAGCFFLAMLN